MKFSRPTLRRGECSRAAARKLALALDQIYGHRGRVLVQEVADRPSGHFARQASKEHFAILSSNLRSSLIDLAGYEALAKLRVVEILHADLSSFGRFFSYPQAR